MTTSEHTAMARIPIPQRNIGCQTMLSCNDVVYHGHLRKRSTVNKLLDQMKVPFKWKQVYVVLRDGCIYFYDDETSSNARATSLYGFTSVERCPLEVQREIPWPFKLVCALEERDRDYVLCAASEKELTTWMKCIEEQINYANGFSSFRSSSVLSTAPGTDSDVQKTSQRPLPTLPDSRLLATLRQLEDANYATDSSSSEDEESSSVKKVSTSKIKVGDECTMSYGEVDKSTAKANKTFVSQSSSSTGRVAGAIAKLTGTVSPTIVNEQHLLKKKQFPKELEIMDAYWDKEPDEADEFMKSIDVEGAYMIRCSTDQESQTLLVRVERNVKKYKIQRIENKFSLDSQGPYFNSLAQLVSHYKMNDILNRNTRLTKSYSAIHNC